MNDPDARDYKWLVTRERGDGIDDVSAKERAPYEHMGALLGGGVAPGAAWRKRVLDAIDAVERIENPPRPEPVTAPEPAAPAPVVPLVPKKRKAVPWIAGGLAAAAAVAIVVLWPPKERPEAPGHLALMTSVQRDPAKPRTRAGEEQAMTGDSLDVHAEVDGPAEIRVYGGSGERLLATCNDRGGCTVERKGERRTYRFQVRLDVPGVVYSVVFVGERIPASSGARAGDLEAASSASIRYLEGTKPIRVL